MSEKKRRLYFEGALFSLDLEIIRSVHEFKRSYKLMYSKRENTVKKAREEPFSLERERILR